MQSPDSLGIAQGFFFLSFSCILGIFGLSLLTLAAQAVGGRNISFNSLSKATFPAAAVIMDVAVAITVFGAAISYLIVGIYQCRVS